MLGEWIREERKRRGWTQADLAKRAQLSPQAIGLIEQGKRTRLSIQTLTGLARAFGISIDDLLGRAPTEEADEFDALIGELEALGVAHLTVQSYRRLGHLLTAPADREDVLVALRDLVERVRQAQRVKANRRQQPVPG